MLDLREHFSRFLDADPDRLHFAAHSHAAWPDVTRAAQLQAWDDAAQLMDGKWEHILGPVWNEAQGHVARVLGLPDPRSVVFAPNTHELLRRILSCLPHDRAPRVLTTDAEFHSFARQSARLEEDGLLHVARVPAEPFATFSSRFVAALTAGRFDLVWLSDVFFNSGYVLSGMDRIAAAAGEAMLVVDGYHSFLAGPVDFSQLASRAFYLSGGYKYAMSGEGVCFMHCPPGWGKRPRDTGWYAAFGALSSPQEGVAHAEDAWRFMGATFDPTGLYRFNAVMRWMQQLGVTPSLARDHAHALQARFLTGLPAAGFADWPGCLLVPDAADRGAFLTFRRDDAAPWHARLAAAGIITDLRADRLRVGFGVYQTAACVDRLLERMATLRQVPAAA